MPTEPTVGTVTVGAHQVRVLRAGAGDAAILLLHGGVPGATPYAACADLWRPLLPALAGEHARVIAPDLPGAGGTVPSDPSALTVAGQADLVAGLAARLGVRRAAVVTHADADLVGLLLARRRGTPVSSLTLVSPTGALPTGDMPENLTLLHPPRPMWSTGSQRWALERLSRRPEHVTPELLALLAEHAAGAAHATALGWQDDFDVAADVRADRIAAANAVYGHARDQGFAVPITLLAGAADPLVDLDRLAVLADILATTPGELDLRVLGDCGHFPFREQPHRAADVIRGSRRWPRSR
ncbi:alpha/beta fold hydrolase [Pseudonocardia acaciae]|uniref:alpha/beta fold hydrolase n=1 Tax=Pseudonocardia acaciae TaxID=551276 RepID=UPI0006872A95|nr:alpha/beta hydrolase [Pseudonocardia acaciae]